MEPEIVDGNDFGFGSLRGYTSESPQVSIHVETFSRPAMGQESAEWNDWRFLEHITASGGEAADTMRSVQELRTRLQDTVGTEVAHTGEASSIDSPGQTSLSLSSGPAPSSSSGTAPAAGRPALQVGNVVVATFDDTADDEINDSGDGD